MLRPLTIRLTLCLILCLGVGLESEITLSAQTASLADSSEQIRSGLLRAQLAVGTDPAALTTVREIEATYEDVLAPVVREAAPEAHQRAQAGFEVLKGSAQAADAVSFAAARAQVWTAILAGSERVVEAALEDGDFGTARTWLALREFRSATRYSRPGGDATLAVERFANGAMPVADAVLTVRADLFDTYQTRLSESLRDLSEADRRGFAARRAELGALAEGYFAILAPAYAEQRGAVALETAKGAFANLLAASLSGDNVRLALEAVDGVLDGFRAAPLSPAEQARRSGQLLRFIDLIPVEYGRGVSEGRVIHDFEIQEAVTFYEAAASAFADLKDVLPPGAVSQAVDLFELLSAQLTGASQGDSTANPAGVRKAADELIVLLKDSLPEAWLSDSRHGDFDVVASLLDQVESAVRNGEYDMAESARLEAYAIMETGPEARLLILAPQLTSAIESQFWNGQGQQKGLAYLIRNQAALKELQASRAELDALLAEAEQVVGQESSPVAVAANAGVIVFREGMEAVVILASLMSSMRRAEERKYRKPMWLGTLLAFGATLATWMLAREVLQSLARYGEKLEAVVSLIAVGVLLVIMNWFFHKVYWTSWIAQFHNRKRQLLSGEAGLALGLVTLGFASVYREGFEVVLFLQAMVLEAGSSVVLAGTAFGLLLVILLGLITFRLQVRLPYRSMLTVTGVMIGVVLLQIAGQTVYAMQVVGWMPIHAVQGVALPYWWGSWFGVYPTWEGLILQFLAAGFVISSYYLAERKQKSRRRITAPSRA